MKRRDIYKSGYSFAKEKNQKEIRRLKIVSIVLPLFILFLLVFGIIRSLDFFSPKKEEVKQLFDPAAEERRINEYETRLAQYESVSIPYDDPQNRFSVIFMTPYVSDKIGVVIYTDKDYDNVKREAAAIVQKAREKVSIDTVTYIDRFKQK